MSLKRNSRARVLNKHSRLGCQVVLSQELQEPFEYDPYTIVAQGREIWHASILLDVTLTDCIFYFDAILLSRNKVLHPYEVSRSNKDPYSAPTEPMSDPTGPYHGQPILKTNVS
ncbi:hypothetical protein HAX54_051030 [Datura stramonium]|uniref:Uncharacterized protein n=1 Tax=Datura stramonium TaxID=4076 RepID=A0ABS8RR52_DATST|nr:hypothetical protein [Datura stramonium]